MVFVLSALTLAVSPAVPSHSLSPAQLATITAGLTDSEQHGCVTSGKWNASQFGEDLTLLPYLLAVTGGKPGKL